MRYILLSTCLIGYSASFRLANNPAPAPGSRPRAKFVWRDPVENVTIVNVSGLPEMACERTPENGSAMDTYMTWLDNPPCEASTAAKALVAKADELAALLDKETLTNLGDVDVVVAGSSYLDRYYVGFNMIMSRVKNQVVNVKRISGASSGANAPFDMLLMGEEPAITKFLTFGLLGDRFHSVYYGGVSDQSYWFRASDWLFEKYSADLPRLNDEMYVWMSCKWHCSWWELMSGTCKDKVQVHKFDNATMSRLAYRATGSVFPPVEVNATLKWCTDGGVGKVFKDGLRPQITISPTKAINPFRAMIGYTLEEYAEGILLGQEAAIEFLRTGTTTNGRPGMTPVKLCQKGAECADPEL